MRRVVVTGLGLVTPLGGDVETTWKNLIAGKSGAGPITRFDTADQNVSGLSGGSGPGVLRLQEEARAAQAAA